MLAWPAESTKRSRSGQAGSAGSKRRWRVNSVCATAAAPMGMPGWPELAFCTPSTARKRMVSMQRSSRVCALATGLTWILSFGSRKPVSLRPPA